MPFSPLESNVSPAPTSRRTLRWIATGFGLGYSPVASGTVGSLPGLAIAAALAGQVWWIQALVVAGLILLLIPVCGAAEDLFGRKDDGRIVADEYATLPLCFIGIPWTAHLWLLPVGFVLHRVLDIVKPFPARRAQALGGGLGIMIDDVITSLYALGIMHAVMIVWQRG